jgi:hypothetical protein
LHRSLNLVHAGEQRDLEVDSRARVGRHQSAGAVVAAGEASAGRDGGGGGVWGVSVKFLE